MRKPHLLTAVACGLLVVGVAISGVLAQTRPTGVTQGYRTAPVAPVAPGGLALIDVSKVFKQHTRFTSMMNMQPVPGLASGWSTGFSPVA